MDIRNVTKSVNHKWFINLLHSVISLPDVTSCDNYHYSSVGRVSYCFGAYIALNIFHSHILRERRLPWVGHVDYSLSAVRTACDIQVDGRRGPGRPKLTWKKLTKSDCHECKLRTIDPQERST